MSKRWVVATLTLIACGVVAVTIARVFRPLRVWYADEYVVAPFFDRYVHEAWPYYEYEMRAHDQTIARLKRIGLPAVEAMLLRLREIESAYSITYDVDLEYALGAVAPEVPDSLPMLLANADSDSALVRAMIASCLWKYDSEVVVAYLAKLRSDPDEYVRWCAGQSLTMIAPGDLVLINQQAGRLATPEGPNSQVDVANKLPAWWNANDPLPIEKSNCVRCHLTAGRELTVPVRDFARSAHDRAKLSCNDCHGGNTDDDTMAHEHEFDFIGTKLSSHIAACADCHADEAEAFRKGPHYWDLSKRINRDYPVCIDCHGNHDVGKPPADFSLTNVCADCHKLDATSPEIAAVVAENDRLWKILRDVHAKNKSSSDPTPIEYRRELAAVRRGTARLVHPAAQVSREQADSLNGRARRLRERLETWLKEQE